MKKEVEEVKAQTADHQTEMRQLRESVSTRDERLKEKVGDMTQNLSLTLYLPQAVNITYSTISSSLLSLLSNTSFGFSGRHYSLLKLLS